MFCVTSEDLQGAGVSSKNFTSALTVCGAMLAAIGLLIISAMTSGGAPEPQNVVNPGIVAVSIARTNDAGFIINREGRGDGVLTKKTYAVK